jgi:hypothetical protein
MGKPPVRLTGLRLDPSVKYDYIAHIFYCIYYKTNFRFLYIPEGFTPGFGMYLCRHPLVRAPVELLRSSLRA